MCSSDLGFLNQTQLATAYVAADALVLPSDCLETWGLVVNEAMACGLPIIASDQVGCVDDLVQNDKTGLIYPYGDIQALSSAMRQMVNNPVAARQMGITGSQLVQNNYTLTRAAQGISKAAAFVFCRSEV